MKNYKLDPVATIITFCSDPHNKALLDALFSVSEFCYAHEQLNSVAYATDNWTSVAHRVYLNACYNYLATWFAISGGNQLRKLLSPLGLGKYLDAVDKCLERQLGKITYRKAVQKYRNKVSVHPEFAGQSQLTIVDQSIGLAPHEVARAMQNFLDEMYTHMRGIKMVLEEELGKQAPSSLVRYLYDTGWI